MSDTTDIKSKCKELYDSVGQGAVLLYCCDHPDKVNWEWCPACECESATLKGEHECLVCGWGTRTGVCPQCGESFISHNDDGSCVKD